ncbi:hypothetical protein DFH06DRAFT_1127428 [Mycena polygramma]|nr:hypothetical protein DFH06DRAFT_1127428 [Mycena polygramma]
MPRSGDTLATADPDLEPAPQWALDLNHNSRWHSYLMMIMYHNSTVHLQEHKARTLARNCNATLTHDVQNLVPICLPFPRIDVPTIPTSPAPGAPTNLPPVFNPPAYGPTSTTVHALFPATLGDLRALTPDLRRAAVEDLALLFPAYSLNNPHPNGPVAAQREVFARHVGVRSIVMDSAIPVQ